VRCDGIQRLRVESDSITGETKALVFGDKRIGIEMEEKPAARGLKRLTGSEGITERFERGFNLEGQATLKLVSRDGKERVLAWDPVSKHIVSDVSQDGEWTYKVTPGKEPREYAAIERTNSKGEVEFWHKDWARGREIEEKDGVRKVTTWFASGPFAGKTRKIQETRDGKTTVTYKAAYDQHGSMLREFEILDGKERAKIYKNDKRGKPVMIYLNGKPQWKRAYDAAGRLVAEELVGFYKSTYRYFNDGTLEQTMIYTDRSGAMNPGMEEKEIIIRDHRSWPVSIRNQSGYLWLYQYDEHGAEIKRTLAQKAGPLLNR